ncbi:MAG: AAA family ATPase [Planctomycetales bacterium]|nr:AAA family ATPase [Planctomycetales bacterium]
MSYKADDIKRQAAGRWVSILESVCGLSAHELNPRVNGPCPKCGGTDRFRALNDVAETGALFCNQCHNKNTTPKSGDGFAAIQWLRNCTFSGALKLAAEAFGHSEPGNPTTNGKQAPKKKKVHPTADVAADVLAWGMVQSGILSEQRKPDFGWRYRNADGSDAGAVYRWNLPDGRKEIRQVSRIDNGGTPAGWITSAMAEPRPLYRLPELVESSEVWICEGEKAADAMVSLGLQATTSAGGSNAADKSNWRPLNGKCVYILPDNDEPGEKFATVVLGLIRQQAPDATVEVKRLKDDWPEIPDGGDVYDWQEYFDSADSETLRARVLALPDRIGEYVPTKPEVCEVKQQGRTFEGKSAAELWDLADQPVEWLVENVFSCDQPTIFGAKQKSLKTTLLTDLAVSLASGYAWLGRFDIPAKRRVLFVTGEASEAAAIRKVKRAATSRNLRREDFTDSLRIEAITFPRLPSDKDCAAVAEAVKEHGIEVVLLDPLYMGLSGLNTANLTEVGPAMRQFMEACRPANLIIAHHVKKTASFDDAPNLEDLSQAGIAEFAGNYWLMGRMSEYIGDGMHELAIRYGGRDEQFGLLKLDFDERDWEAEFTSLIDHREDQKQRRENDRVGAQLQAIKGHLSRHGGQATLAALAEAASTKPKRESFQNLIDDLCNSGQYERFTTKGGNNKPCEALRVKGQKSTDTVL